MLTNTHSLIPTMSIFLVGPMGVGKTTIGRHLASALNLVFKDSDQEIEARTGASIPLIFEIEGEEGFRKRENAMIAELTMQQKIVLATGGGVVLNADNRIYLQSRGYVVYLYASVKYLLERSAHSRNRPLLNTANPQERLENILRERHPLYKRLADVTIETNHRTIRQVVKQIIKRLQYLENHEHSAS